MDENVRLILEHLKKTTEISEMEHTTSISADEFRNKLQVWRESSATSPSGLHLGHYKALIAKHKYSTIPEDEDDEQRSKREEINQMQEDLFKAHLRLINYALERGYSYSRWKKLPIVSSSKNQTIFEFIEHEQYTYMRPTTT